MKRAGLIALLLAAATSAAAAVASRDAATPSPARCGGTLWRLKTFSDPSRGSVRLTPMTTTIAAIAAQPFPRPVPTRRRTPFQKQTWEVVAQVTQYRLHDGGVQLVLFDAGSYLNAVIPLPSCLSSGTRARADIAATWKTFTARCGRATLDWQPLGAIVYARGIGFWSPRGTAQGSARNGAELHPVTGFRIVAGCR